MNGELWLWDLGGDVVGFVMVVAVTLVGLAVLGRV